MTSSCVLCAFSTARTVLLVGVVGVWNLVGKGWGLVLAHCWALRDQAGCSLVGGRLVAWCLPWPSRVVCVGLVVGGLVV